MPETVIKWLVVGLIALVIVILVVVPLVQKA